MTQASSGEAGKGGHIIQSGSVCLDGWVLATLGLEAFQL